MRFLILPLVAALSLPAWASDADIVAARDAVRRNDVPALMTAMAGSQNDLLAPYPAYWQLTRDLDNASDADVRAFMTRWPNSVLAERVRADWLRRRHVPHPFGMYRVPLHFDGALVEALPRLFIDCHQPAYPTIDAMRQRVRQQPGWQVVEMATGHFPMLTQPEALVRHLLAFAHG